MLSAMGKTTDELIKLSSEITRLPHPRERGMLLHTGEIIATAKLLFDRGADIDARDIDHESTPAQYMLDGRQTIARYLVERGCHTDIPMAAALGDPALARKHLDADPECIRVRVSDEFIPMVGGRIGGTIYQWVLGWVFGFRDVLDRAQIQIKLNQLLANAGKVPEVDGVLRRGGKPAVVLAHG